MLSYQQQTQLRFWMELSAADTAKILYAELSAADTAEILDAELLARGSQHIHL